MKKESFSENYFVEFNSGLGNQLFQLNYSFFLQLEFKRSIQMLRREQPSRPDRPFDLDEFLCSDNTLLNPEILSFQELLGRRITKIPFLKNSNLNRLNQINWIHEKEEFSFSTPTGPAIGKANCFTGYFQNSEYVERAFGSYSLELDRFLEEKYDQVLTKHKVVDGKTVLHVRRGDLLKPECKGMGMLSAQYYLDSVGKLGVDWRDVIILTDDKINTSKVALELGVVDVYGPDQLSTWETLAVFTRAPHLVSANSTLSWWGAYIGREKGNQAVFPSIWFENWKPNPGGSLHIRGQIMQESHFE
jgi:hypothetical protein